MFINKLIRDLDNPRYFEVGSWKGSTLCSAINKNTLRGTAIDNWSEFGGPKNEFMQNYDKFRNENVDINIIESDFRAVDYSKIGSHDVYLFDGPHSLEDQYDGLVLALDALADEFIFIVDDWNWVQVREGTLRAIMDTPVELVYSVEIRTSLDNSHGFPPAQLSDWHNGYFLSVLKKINNCRAAIGCQMSDLAAETKIALDGGLDNDGIASTPVRWIQSRGISCLG